MKLQPLPKRTANNGLQTAAIGQASLTVSLATVQGENIATQTELLPLDLDSGNNPLQVRNDEEIATIATIATQNKVRDSDLSFSRVSDDEEDYSAIFNGLSLRDTQIETEVYSALFSENTGNTGNSGNSLVYDDFLSGNPSGNPVPIIATHDTQITVNVLPGRYDPTYGKPALPKELWCYGLEWTQAEPLHAHYKQLYFAALSIQDGKYCIEGKL
jgi:hypothetical protein